MCLVILAFMRFGGPGRNKPKVLAAIRVNHHQNAALGVSPQGHLSHLRGFGLVIGDGKGIWIVENQNGTGKTDFLLLEVPLAFPWSQTTPTPALYICMYAGSRTKCA